MPWLASALDGTGRSSAFTATGSLGSKAGIARTTEIMVLETAEFQTAVVHSVAFKMDGN